MTRFVLFVMAVMLAAPLVAVHHDAEAQATSGCAERFPLTEWTPAATAGPVTLWTAEVNQATADRYRDQIDGIVGLLEADVGQLDPIDVCVFGSEVTLDATGLLPENQRLHAVVFPAEDTVVVGATLPRFLEEAVTFGLTYTALWQTAEQLGFTGYPEPLATTIGQWYMARVKDRLDQHRSAMRTGLFFSDPEGTAESRAWTEQSQSDAYVWNPQFLESPIGDIVAFAVATRGAEVLSDPSQELWSAIELEYREALRQELVGEGSGTTWMWGAGIIIGALLLAGFVAWLARREKLKRRGR